MDFYTKSEIDEKFGVTISSPSWRDLYTKTEIETNIGTPETLVLPANMLDFYTKTEIDSIDSAIVITLTGRETWGSERWGNQSYLDFYTLDYSNILQDLRISGTSIEVLSDEYPFGGVASDLNHLPWVDKRTWLNADGTSPTVYNGYLTITDSNYGTNAEAFAQHLADLYDAGTPVKIRIKPA